MLLADADGLTLAAGPDREPLRSQWPLFEQSPPKSGQLPGDLAPSSAGGGGGVGVCFGIVAQVFVFARIWTVIGGAIIASGLPRRPAKAKAKPPFFSPLRGKHPANEKSWPVGRKGVSVLAVVGGIARFRRNAGSARTPDCDAGPDQLGGRLGQRLVFPGFHHRQRSPLRY